MLVKEVTEVESDSTIFRFVCFIGFATLSALFSHESAFFIKCSVDGARESPQSVGLVTADDPMLIVVESLDIELESDSDFPIDTLTSGSAAFTGFG